MQMLYLDQRKGLNSTDLCGEKMLRWIANGGKTGFSKKAGETQLNLHQTGHNLQANQFSYNLQRVTE